GGGPQVTLKLVAQYGDACNVGGGKPDVAKEKLEILKRHCDNVGRDYDEITKSSTVMALPIPKGADPEQASAQIRETYGNVSFETFSKDYLVADVDVIGDKIQGLRDAGIDYIINYIPGLAYDLQGMQVYENEIIPKFTK